MVAHVYVLHCCVVDGIAGKQICGTIVNVECCWGWDILVEFYEESVEPDEFLRGFSSCNVLFVH